jgi:hypothetical protein
LSVAPAIAFAVLPQGLRDDLLGAFTEIVKNYQERRWEPSELNGGKLCEAVFTIVDGYLQGGIYPSRAKKPGNFPKACLDLETKYAAVPNSRSPRILIPRKMLGLYDIRNNRGVGHAGGDVDPNQMDATIVLADAKWLVAELVRLLHELSTDEATELVEALVERHVPWVWSDDDIKRVLRLGLTYRQQTLVLLLSQTGPASEENLARWIEHPRIRDYRTVLRQMHKQRQIEYGEGGLAVRLLPPGVDAAEKLVSSELLQRVM